MPSTAPEAEKHQKHWDKLCRDPSLNDLPYKVETNRRDQLILTRVSMSRSVRMSDVVQALDRYAPRGRSLPSFAIATPEGAKVPDVIWTSEDRLEEMKATGDPTTLAPEICVEVMSGSNDWEEMREKRRLYVEAGAEEVWVVGEGGAVWFWDGDGQLDSSEIAPDFPDKL